MIPASTCESNSVVKPQTAKEGNSTQTEGPTNFVLVHLNDTEHTGMVIAPADITVEHLRGTFDKLISYGKMACVDSNTKNYIQSKQIDQFIRIGDRKSGNTLQMLP